MDLTQEKLKEYLTYNPETGVFVWSDTYSYKMHGKVAGLNHKNTAVVIVIRGRKYPAHRLAHLYMTGAWPKACIDHVNLNPLDNSWKNLREATYADNNRNKKIIYKRNKCGYKGVVKTNCKVRPFCAHIKVNYKSIYLGYFETPELAHEAYKEAAKKYHGEFANFG